MDKPFWKSKTVWAGVIIAVYGLLNASGMNLEPYRELVISIASGIGIVGIRQALK